MAQLNQKNLFYDVQNAVVGILNANESLSAVNFFAENNKAIEEEIETALRRQGICGVVMVNDAVYQGRYQGESTVWQIDKLIVQVVENVPVNRAKNNPNYVGTCQDVAYAAAETLGGASSPYRSQFQLIDYSCGEDQSLLVSKVTFKCLAQAENSLSSNTQQG